MFRTVCLRLTLYYTLLFGFLSLCAFLLVYLNIAHGLNERTDDQLHATVREFIETKRDRGLVGLHIAARCGLLAAVLRTALCYKSA